MKREFIYITSIILLLIIPISVVGVDVSVYKCKHRGLAEVSFYGLSKFIESKCCCSVSENKNESDDLSANSKAVACSGCDDNIETTTDESPNMSDGCSECSEITENHATDSGEPAAAGPANESVSFRPIACETALLNDSFRVDNVPCCSTSNDYFALAIESPTPELNHVQEFTYILAPNSFCLYEILPTRFEKIPAKEKIYPLKEPINKIISLISLSSNSLDDDGILA